MAEWWSVQGDTRRQYSTLTGGDGAPLDLAGMTATLRMAEAAGRRPRVVKGSTAIEQAGIAPNFTSQGVVRFNPAASDVAAPGDYVCQWILVTIAGDIRTVPDQAPFVWRIAPRV